MSEFEWDKSTGVMTLPRCVTLESLSGLLKPKGILEQPVTTVDFNQVEQVDSAILAVLLVWSKNATPQGGTKKSPPLIKVLNLPKELRSLMQLYNLESVVQLV